MITTAAAVHHCWSDIPAEPIGSLIERKFFTGERMTVARLNLKRTGGTRTHTHEAEEVLCILSGALKVTVDGETTVIREGEVIQIRSGVPHRIEALEDTSLLGVFSPIRQDWLDKTDTYFER
jgi:quercetin dioxygenase-like cupin family protein